MVKENNSNINFKIKELDFFYFEWKKGIKKTSTQWMYRYRKLFEEILSEKYTNIRKNKLLKIAKNLIEIGVVRLFYKTYSINVSLATLEKKANKEEKVYFWKNLEENYSFFQHLFFYLLIILDSTE